MGISLIVQKGQTVYDMTNLVQKINWGGKKSAMPRSIEVTMLDSDSHGHDRPDITIEDGQYCLFRWNGKELFRGIFFMSNQSRSRTGAYKAYDNGIYLAKNMDTFTYKKKTATYIFSDICKKFEIPYSAVETGYSIADLTMPNVTAADAVWSALSKPYKGTGGRYYILSEKGTLKLIARADNLIQWVIEEGANVIDFSRERSLENVYTRIVLYSDANKVLASAKDTSIEAKLGIMQYTEQADSKEKAATLQATANNLLTIKKKTEETLEVEALGIPYIHSGVAVFLNIPYLGIKKTYYVDEDEHEFVGEKHTMRLKLNVANEVEKQDEDD